MIDGETLPLLSEEHLLDTLGLKLGPALKIRSQVENTGSDTDPNYSNHFSTPSPEHDPKFNGFLCLNSPPLQVSRRLGSMLYMMNLPLSAATLQATPGKPGDRSPEMGSPVNCNSEEMMGSPRDPDVLKAAEHLQETESSPPSASCETA